MIKDFFLGPVALGRIPRIIAVFDQVVSANDLVRIYNEGARLAEIRFDLLQVSFKDSLIFAETIRKAAPFGIIATLRETGSNKANRVQMFRQIMPLVDAFDIEIDSPIKDEVIQSASDKVAIVSHHDFDKMPSDQELESLADEALKSHAKIVKIAGMAKSRDDAERMILFTKSAKYPVIAIAMGEAGAYARIEALKYGSVATYAFIGSKPVAPGQRSVKEIADILNSLYLQ